MITSLELLEHQILKLTPAERSHLLARLVASLDKDAGVEAEWDAVADARQSELDSGVVQAVPMDEALARLEARFKG